MDVETASHEATQSLCARGSARKKILPATARVLVANLIAAAEAIFIFETGELIVHANF
jgi:hypothetical protein